MIIKGVGFFVGFDRYSVCTRVLSMVYRALYSVGEHPFILLKVRLKDDRLEKPDFKEISVIGRFGTIRSCSAARILLALK